VRTRYAVATKIPTFLTLLERFAKLFNDFLAILNLFTIAVSNKFLQEHNIIQAE
jgi:hypothetical protein